MCHRGYWRHGNLPDTDGGHRRACGYVPPCVAESRVLTVTKTVYYCEFCKRHRMTAAAIEKHEPRCIYNPGRSVCGWHERGAFIPAPANFSTILKEDGDIDWLRRQMDGCPACMLSVVVQAGLSGFERDVIDFDYKAEVTRFREEEQRSEAF